MKLFGFFLISAITLAKAERGQGRNLVSGLFGQVQQVGSHWMHSVQNGAEEMGKVAKVLAGDASDAIKTVATARIDDYVPNLEDEMNYLQEQQDRRRPMYYQYRQSYSPGQGLVTSMLRMVGLDEHKLGMMALNVLVYLAEYLAKNFLGMESELDNEIPEYRSIVQNDGMMAGMFKMVSDANANSERIKQKLLAPEVTEQMIDLVPQQFLGTDTSCIQMFLCKVEPAFWSMQTTTKDYEGFSLARSLTGNFDLWLRMVYYNLPDLKSLRQFGDRCNEKYPRCQLLNHF